MLLSKFQPLFRLEYVLLGQIQAIIHQSLGEPSQKAEAASIYTSNVFSTANQPVFVWFVP